MMLVTRFSPLTGRRTRRALSYAAALGLIASIGPAALAEPVVALTTPAPLVGSQLLFAFDSATPAVTSLGLPITGLIPGEILLDIDFRPSTGELFALGSSARLYIIDTATGAVRQRGSGAFPLSLRGSHFGIDFNPLTDHIRVTSSAGQNFRLDPDEGTLIDSDPTVPGVQPDADLRFAPGDPAESITPRVVACAYSTGVTNRPTATLFDIDTGLNLLAHQAPPDDGSLHSEAPIGVAFQRDVVGFDISPRTNAAYFTGPGSLSLYTGFYTLDLASGDAQRVGNIGIVPVSVQKIAVRSSACPCDFNHDRALNSQDFFDFLAAFFAGSVAADFDRDGSVNSRDFFDFVGCIFEQPGACGGH